MSAAISPVSMAYAMPSPLNGFTGAGGVADQQHAGHRLRRAVEAHRERPRQQPPLGGLLRDTPNDGGSIDANALNSRCAETSLKFSNVFSSPAPRLIVPPATGNSQPVARQQEVALPQVEPRLEPRPG